MDITDTNANTSMLSDDGSDASYASFMELENSGGSDSDVQSEESDDNDGMFELMVCMNELNSRLIGAIISVHDSTNYNMSSAVAQVANAAGTSGILNNDVATLVASNVFATRSPTVFGQRLCWDNFATKFGHMPYFTRHIRMPLSSFNKLLAYVYDELSIVNTDQVNRRGGEIIPELSLYCCIRYLAGASYTDVFFGCGISKSAFYAAVWKTMKAI